MRRNLLFLVWDVRMRVELTTDAAVEHVRARCPGLPDLSGTPDATIGFAPSVVIGGLLRFALPVYVAIVTRSPTAVATSIVVGRVAFRLGDPLLLRRVDRLHRARWQRADLFKQRLAARATTLSSRASTLALRAAVACFAAGALAALIVLAVAAVGVADTDAITLAGTFSILALFASLLLASAMFAALTFEALVPTLLGPTDDSAYLVSRTDVDLLRPLLRSGPAGALRDAWDVLKTLRP